MTRTVVQSANNIANNSIKSLVLWYLLLLSWSCVKPARYQEIFSFVLISKRNRTLFTGSSYGWWSVILTCCLRQREYYRQSDNGGTCIHHNTKEDTLEEKEKRKLKLNTIKIGYLSIRTRCISLKPINVFPSDSFVFS